MHQLMAATWTPSLRKLKPFNMRSHPWLQQASPVANDYPAQPQGLAGPKEVDKKQDYWRSHQVPFAEMASKPEHVLLSEEWMKSYKPSEVFDENGAD